jgi:hypothetical protein
MSAAQRLDVVAGVFRRGEFLIRERKALASEEASYDDQNLISIDTE